MGEKRILSKQADDIQQLLKMLNIEFSCVELPGQGIVFEFIKPVGRTSQLSCYIVISSSLSPEQSFNLIMTAVLEEAHTFENNLNSLASFLTQLSAVLPPLDFLLDFDSGKVLLRQSFICANDSKPDLQSFIDAVQWVAPKLQEPLARLKSGRISADDARLMADFLSESCYEEMGQ